MVRLIYAIIVLIIIGIIYYARRRKSDNTEAPQGTADNTTTIQQVSAPTEMLVIVMQGGTRMEGTVKMTQGLQIFDANGNIILDVTDRMTRVIDTFDVAGTARNMVTTNKTYTLPSAKHNLWIHMVDMDTSTSGHVDYTMSRTDDVTVSVQIASGRKTKIIVGVY